MSKGPRSFKPRKFNDAQSAFAAICEIYDANVTWLRESFFAFADGHMPKHRISACYPYIRVTTETATRADTRLSYGFVPRPGSYSTTITRPDIFDHYLMEQLRLLFLNHHEPIEIGVSDTPIPIHFALGEDFHLERDLSAEQINAMSNLFDQPNLDLMDDEVANGTHETKPGHDAPLALFNAPRIDLSIMRLRHYTGTNARHFQNYVIYTNYQFYIDQFVRICRDIMAPTDNPELRAERLEYSSFVEPGNRITTNKNMADPGESDDPGLPLTRMPQMPAYHLKRKDGSGITMINIGVGPSNAKTITDHVAVLRPHAWLMLGHCAGLRNSQSLGDYVLAHGYLREDNVLYRDLHPSIPIPALSEIQISLERAVEHVTGLQGYDLKKIMRTGTVATVDDRNWELRPTLRQNLRLSQSRAIALDMESGTIAANGFRFRVPYGTLLCVSDRPLHGQLKLPGMADKFYRDRVDQHLQIGLLAMAMLREYGPERLHSRKLRSFNEVAFQ
ncbi:AMP nucleosidase [Micavibrio aeruginosavorus]|uniref:AMP nucleosidase n=1 Tax=Micavibrio aeruginosavorus (strain ARL-13) TaxID=856793 RepID=G2KNH1_MICAA|nr:AMP nucleosidase [Micavibrio aeruginosavorus]AEP09819.1 AMP nucleosidase [Micavibrio aeruginosavorus ARL-13]